MASVIGAALTGSKALTASSGPGISLKQELIGYACIAEVPCVIINVMRGGPSTGMPTGPGQSDVVITSYSIHYTKLYDGLCIDLLTGCRSHRDRSMVTVGTPLGLHDVRLTGAGRHTGRGTATHNVNNDTGNLGDAGITDQLLLERDTRTRGRGQRLRTGQRCTNNRCHGADLVFHLNELTTNLGELVGKNLGYLVITSYSIHYTKLYDLELVGDIGHEIAPDVLEATQAGDVVEHHERTDLFTPGVCQRVPVGLQNMFDPRITSYNVCYTKLLRNLSVALYVLLLCFKTNLVRGLVNLCVLVLKFAAIKRSFYGPST